jgi:lipopolysaccharide/colanic/teichoic acid biosynthesis glycosyltransferase
MLRSHPVEGGLAPARPQIARRGQAAPALPRLVYGARFAAAAIAGALFGRGEPVRTALDTLPSDWRASVGTQHDLIRRAGDVVFAATLLLLALPLLLLAVAAIALDSRGAVLHCQTRVGLGGRPFTLYKLRSMRVGAESGGPTWAAPADPRITRVGAVLRRLRIDELPQLLNVLRGDMHMVGPRPERPHFVDLLTAAIPHYAARSCVRPGITGWAQVNHPYGASIEDARAKLEFDLFYVARRNLFLDAVILLATIRVILWPSRALAVR